MFAPKMMHLYTGKQNKKYILKKSLISFWKCEINIKNVFNSLVMILKLSREIELNRDM